MSAIVGVALRGPPATIATGGQSGPLADPELEAARQHALCFRLDGGGKFEAARALREFGELVARGEAQCALGLNLAGSSTSRTVTED